jgi:5-methylcytosine-specific restriction protein B
MFENILEIHQNDANLNDIKNSSIFYFQKGQDAINKWLDMELSDALKEKIVALSLDYDQFKNIAISDTVLYPIQQLLFEIISYCDEKANDKKKYNQYEDKRTLVENPVKLTTTFQSKLTTISGAN